MYQRQLSAVPFSLSLLTLPARVRVPSRCLSCASILLLRRYLPPSLCISTYIYTHTYICIYTAPCTPCDRSACIDNEILETVHESGTVQASTLGERGYRSRNFPRRPSVALLFRGYRVLYSMPRLRNEEETEEASYNRVASR